MRKLVTRKGKLEKLIKDNLSGLINPEPEINNILAAVEEYERDNLVTIEKLRKRYEITTNRINGALRQTINAHGPITKLLIGSASKRILGNLLAGEITNNTISIKSMFIGLVLGVLLTSLIMS